VSNAYSKRAKHLFVGLLACLAPVGCYQATGELKQTDVIDLNVEKASGLLANGHSLVTLTITVHPDTDKALPITVSTSSGVVNFKEDPTAKEAKTIVVNNSGSGEMTLPLKVGNVVGETIVSATIAGVRAEAKLTLGAALPSAIGLVPEATTVMADGTNTLAVQVVLFGEAGAMVSQGVELQFAACCAAKNELTLCSDNPPLVPPKLAEVKTSQTLAIKLLTRRWKVSNSTDSRAIWLVADVKSDSMTSPPVSLCKSKGSKVRDAIAIDVAPELAPSP